MALPSKVRGLALAVMESLDFHQAKALLEWQLDAGVDEALSETPIDRYALQDKPKPGVKAQPTKAEITPPPIEAKAEDAVVEAKKKAQAAQDLAGLQAALAAFELCDLKKGARNLVFADGNPAARVMIFGEAPGRDEDMQGRPFVGRAGQLLDKMLDAISMARTAQDATSSVYITNILPWRPPQNRDPKPDEIAMMMPFVQRHVELIAPSVLVLMGNISCQAVLGRRGITRLRGTWTEGLGLPVLPMFHPAYLLRNPAAKREAWADLLSLQSQLRST